MPTDNLTDEQLLCLRLDSGDYVTGDAADQWFTDAQLDVLYVAESKDYGGTVARILEARAAALEAGLGNYSAQGVTVNASATASGLRQAADRWRMSYLNGGYRVG